MLGSGTLVSDPVSRTSATGKSYATCTLRVPVDGAEASLVSCIAFDAAAVAAILALSKGDALSVAGNAKLTEWTGQDGSAKRGLSVVCSKVLTPYLIDKKRKASQPEEVTV